MQGHIEGEIACKKKLKSTKNLRSKYQQTTPKRGMFRLNKATKVLSFTGRFRQLVLTNGQTKPVRRSKEKTI